MCCQFCSGAVGIVEAWAVAIPLTATNHDITGRHGKREVFMVYPALSSRRRVPNWTASSSW